MADELTTNLCADHTLVDVEQRRDAKPSFREAPIRGQRAAQVPNANKCGRPILSETELAGDLIEQVLNVVADAASAVRTQVGQILAYLGGIDSRQPSELIG